jgi:dTMP kinase
VSRRVRPPGRLVAIEGIDGAGKSTLTRALAAALRRRQFSVGLRHEPTNRLLGRLAQEASARDPWTAAIYFTVDRHLVRRELERDLTRFDVVLADRTYFSTLAYQGSALPPRDRARLERIERDATLPADSVILLDLPASEALRRLGARSRGRTPLEKARTLRRVARAYRALARPRRWIVLDARQPTRTLVVEAIDRLGMARRKRSSSSKRR